MNTATVRGRRIPKHPPLSSSSASSSLPHTSEKKIVVSDDLCQRWEQIVAKGRS